MKILTKIIICINCIFLFSSCILDKGDDIEKVKEADRLPHFDITMNDGKEIDSNSDLYGKTSVIVFFDTGCPDCQGLLPEIQKLYDHYKGNDKVRIVLISREESTDSITKYWKEHKFTMPFSGQNDKKIYNLFATSVIPRVYICNKQLIVKFKYTDNPTPTFIRLKAALESIL